MNYREYLIEEFNKFFQSLGIDPLDGFTMIFGIYFLWSIPKLKNWKNFHKTEKIWFYYLFMIGGSLIIFWILIAIHGRF